MNLVYVVMRQHVIYISKESCTDFQCFYFPLSSRALCNDCDNRMAWPEKNDGPRVYGLLILCFPRQYLYHKVGERH